MAYPLEHHFVPTNGLTLHVVQCGPAAGPLVVLLHGFPEFWYAWRQQLGALADAGYRVWAPDQRGYNLSDKPRPVRAYAINELAADVLGLLDAAGRTTAAVVGHDWGAAVAWHLAANFPARIRRTAVLNVPHPRALAGALRRQPRQLLKSWYVFFFQLPWLPETLARLRGAWLARQALRRTSRPGTFSDADLVEYRAAWTRPGALRSMINWYRAAARFGRQAPAGRVVGPLHIIWGRRDAFLNANLAQESLAYCDDGGLTYLDASHWVQHEEAAQVNQLLIDFLRETPA
ncbi:alpha/beta fold hydrolase [Hymenobacter nivis]|uniref:Alpha/beta fold hydrolase n=1 Tax=Hymenobacter nivis TaxID=1850093 RepID=A0A502HCJ7_9BACT|nr:alpha/beta fold hydrolase [Hymenobacter nivis]TPG72387.1 alpha/beta fold hydrolase [Hymenobacter nivis]